MTKKEKVSYIQAALEKVYPKTPIPLDHYSNYTLLVAVVLSAQCTDARVNTITPILFKKADTPQKMAKLSIKEIADIIRPCGLTPMKSKGIKGLSEIICNKYNGEVPDSYEALESLPSVGHKTASVVMSQGFNHPAFPVDTHIHRLMKRWGLSNGRSVIQTEKDAKLLFPKEKWNKLHLQIIFYGRSHSPARGWKKDVDFITSKVNPKIFK
jgi:endonuclease-3|tara:strand:+ start:797 stop:1429 length:633 start_codon:yes stop_codon:yes gene_type:complete